MTNPGTPMILFALAILLLEHDQEVMALVVLVVGILRLIHNLTELTA